MHTVKTLVWAALAAAPGAVLAAPLYQQDFEVDSSASWIVNKGPATTDEAHDFFFDYSTVGIPAAPSGAGTRGVKLQANQSSGVFGGMSVSPMGQSFAGDYEVTFDWWENFNGPFPVGGSGSTQLGTFGLDTSGTVAQWPGGTQDSIWFGATGDGNSSSDWRAYSPTAPTRYTDTAAGIYAAGAVAGSSNGSNAYYSSFGNVAAPAAQSALFPQQSGNTLVGSAGMEWHRVSIKKQGGSVTWTVDGILIATVPVGDDTALTGNNIFFGRSDTNATSSTDVNDVNLLFTLIDNVVVTPEPASLALLAMGGLALRCRRR
ncbi:MAG: PEP-CTERM sorting domain-containing protein [Phycisphaerae bacterium]|nr:PEP-CTERM sorting domain-containing protein [Phycisphaerae bacterium]